MTSRIICRKCYKVILPESISYVCVHCESVFCRLCRKYMANQSECDDCYYSIINTTPYSFLIDNVIEEDTSKTNKS